MVSTEERALAAVEMVTDRPGFRDWPDDFHVRAASVGLERWVGGFASRAEVDDE